MRLDKTLLVVEEVEVMVSGVVSGTESVCWHHILHYTHESKGICYLVIQLVFSTIVFQTKAIQRFVITEKAVWLA